MHALVSRASILGMNAFTIFAERAPIKLTVSHLTMLHGFGIFDDYWKVELLDGELWGVPADGDWEPESDATFPVKLTTDHYQLLDRAGAFLEHHKTELLDGRVYDVSPQYRPHGFVKDEFAYRLRRALEALGSSLHVATEQSVVLERFSEPIPDIILTTEPIGTGAIPGHSVGLLLEIADSSSKSDRVRKASLYARASIPEYWIADVNKRVVLRMWAPDRGFYGQRDKVQFGQQVGSATIDGLVIATADL